MSRCRTAPSVASGAAAVVTALVWKMGKAAVRSHLSTLLMKFAAVSLRSEEAVIQ